MDAVGLVRGRSHDIPPWPDQEAHEARYRVANEALPICFLAEVRHRVRKTFSSPRRATTAIS